MSEEDDVAAERETLAVIRTELKSLSETFKQSISAINDRLHTQDIAIDDIGRSLSNSGRTNWPMLGVLLSAIGGLAVLYIAPVKAAQEASDARTAAVGAAAQADVRRVEEERRRDDDKLDERLQREMRELYDTLAQSSAVTKEMVLGRMSVNEKRIDDVTSRNDHEREEAMRQLHEMQAKLFDRTLGPRQRKNKP